MKKLMILTAAILFTISSVSAQGGVNPVNSSDDLDFLTKGLRYAGGMIGFTVNKEKHESGGNSSDGPKTTNIDIIPTAGYVFSDKFVAGLGIGYSSRITKTFESDPNSGEDIEIKDKYGQFVIRPMLGYYKRLTNRLYCMPFFYLGFGFGNSTNESIIILDKAIQRPIGLLLRRRSIEI